MANPRETQQQLASLRQQREWADVSHQSPDPELLDTAAVLQELTRDPEVIRQLKERGMCPQDLHQLQTAVNRYLSERPTPQPRPY